MPEDLCRAVIRTLVPVDEICQTFFDIKLRMKSKFSQPCLCQRNRVCFLQAEAFCICFSNPNIDTDSPAVTLNLS